MAGTAVTVGVVMAGVGMATVVVVVGEAGPGALVLEGLIGDRTGGSPGVPTGIALTGTTRTGMARRTIPLITVMTGATILHPTARIRKRRRTIPTRI